MSFLAPVFTAVTASAGGAAGLSALSTGLAVAGTVQQAMAMRAQSAYQTQVARRNAQLADKNARAAMENSQIEGRDWGLAAAEEMAMQEAQQSASGLASGTGSAFLRTRNLRKLAARDQTRIREEGTTRTNALRQEAADFRTSAAMSKAEGRNAGAAAFWDVGNSLIGRATRARKIKMGVEV